MVKIVYQNLDEFLRVQQLPILAQEKYLKSKTNWEYGWFVDDNYLLPFIIEKKSFFKRLVFTHSTIYLDDKSTKEREICFLNDIIQKLEIIKPDIDFIYQSLASAVFDIVPDKSIYCKFGSYQIDLSYTEDKLFSNLHGKHRNVIRKAIKENVRIYEGSQYLKSCSELIKRTMARQSLPYISKEYLEKLHRGLGDNISFFVAKYNEVIQGCAVIVWETGDKAYYFHGGSISHPFLGSLNLMHWEIMKTMKKRGVLIYDFVGARINPEKGSKLEGIQRFKSRFGATMVEGYLWKYPLKPFRYFIYRKSAQINSLIKYKKKYKGDIIDQENARKS